MLPTIDLSGRTAFVTGAGSGIGRAIAHALAESGAHVYIAERSAETGADCAASITSAGGRANFVHCDVTDTSSIEAAIALATGETGTLDILVNNAGIPGASAPIDTFEDETWDAVIAVDLSGVFRVTKAAVPALERSGHGAIVNIASTFGMFGAPENAAYAAAKAGVINLTRQNSVDLGPRGVRVNAVCPGYIDNDMAKRGSFMTQEAAAARWATRNRLAALQPLGRQGQTTEVANVVRFLVSDMASFMTGAIVPVDGGCSATFNRGSEVQEAREG